MGAGRDRAGIDRDLFLLVVTHGAGGSRVPAPSPTPSTKPAAERLCRALGGPDIHPKGQFNDQATDD